MDVCRQTGGCQKDIYLFKVNNGSTRTMCEICSKVLKRTPERRHRCRSAVLFINFKQISHIGLVFSIFNFEQVNPVGTVISPLISPVFVKNRKRQNLQHKLYQNLAENVHPMGKHI